MAEWAYPLLTELALGLQGLPWMVVSGLAAPLHAGRFFRAHSDVDIALPLAALPEANQRLRAAGFILTRRLLMTHISPLLRLEIHRRIERRLPPPRLLRRLRFWRQRAGRLQPDCYIDVFPYIEEARDIRVLENGLRLPLGEPLWTTVRLPGGVSVPVQTLAHVNRVKAGRERPCDRFDLALARKLQLLSR